MRPQFTEQWLEDTKKKMGRGGVVNNGVNPVRQTVAGSTPAPSPFAPYANKWEINYSVVLDLERRAGAIRSWKYAGVTFTLSKGQYHRIDFIIGHNDRSVEIAQVKGYHKNIRAAIKGLKWAAQLYPMFTWTIKRWTGTGWDSNYVDY
jgi:hypothetical protein